MLKRWNKIKSQQGMPPKETYKVHLLREENFRLLYKNRMNKYIEEINLNNNTNQAWENFKSTVHKTATELLGKRKKS
jgi:hypothetical protein